MKLNKRLFQAAVIVLVSCLSGLFHVYTLAEANEAVPDVRDETVISIEGGQIHCNMKNNESIINFDGIEMFPDEEKMDKVGGEVIK